MKQTTKKEMAIVIAKAMLGGREPKADSLMVKKIMRRNKSVMAPVYRKSLEILNNLP